MEMDRKKRPTLDSTLKRTLSARNSLFHCQFNLLFSFLSIESFQLTLSVQSMKLKDKTESLRGMFMNKFIKSVMSEENNRL